jgi:hypothetical protein
VLVAAIFAMLTERGIVPKTSSPQEPFKDVIRAHFSSPFPMPPQEEPLEELIRAHFSSPAVPRRLAGSAANPVVEELVAN